MSNLAALYDDQGKFSKAESLSTSGLWQLVRRPFVAYLNDVDIQLDTLSGTEKFQLGGTLVYS